MYSLDSTTLGLGHHSLIRASLEVGSIVMRCIGFVKVILSAAKDLCFRWHNANTQGHGRRTILQVREWKNHHASGFTTSTEVLFFTILNRRESRPQACFFFPFCTNG